MWCIDDVPDVLLCDCVLCEVLFDDAGPVHPVSNPSVSAAVQTPASIVFVA